jgi:ketosteroid isomerase-like protein
MSSAESEVSALLRRRGEAIGRKDIEQLMSLYAQDVVYFDLVPPLRYTGSDALRARFTDWFSRWETAIGQDLDEVTIVASEDIAAAHMLLRTSGTLKTGREVGYWVRVTNAFRRSKLTWLMIHEHVSLPVDIGSGSAVMDLLP